MTGTANCAGSWISNTC